MNKELVALILTLMGGITIGFHFGYIYGQYKYEPKEVRIFIAQRSSFFYCSRLIRRNNKNK